MKIRANFVSNSSSASFIIRWKVIDDEELTVEDAVKRIYEFGDEEISSSVLKCTKPLGRNYFESVFWTCMMNSPDDFGQDAKSLFLCLHAQDKHYSAVGGGIRIEIVSTEIVGD